MKSLLMNTSSSRLEFLTRYYEAMLKSEVCIDESLCLEFTYAITLSTGLEDTKVNMA